MNVTCHVERFRDNSGVYPKDSRLVSAEGLRSCASAMVTFEKDRSRILRDSNSSCKVARMEEGSMNKKKNEKKKKEKEREKKRNNREPKLCDKFRRRNRRYLWLTRIKVISTSLYEEAKMEIQTFS